jgi:hypothetical protein
LNSLFSKEGFQERVKEMKSNKNSCVLVSILFLVIISIIPVEARKHHIRKTKSHNKSGNGDTRGSNFTAPAPAPLPDHNGSYPTPSTIFDVLSFGAKGDGVSDDSKVRNSKQQQQQKHVLIKNKAILKITIYPN